MIQHQIAFGFVQELDDKRNGTIEGLRPGGWLARCYHPTAEAALRDARRASALIGQVYVIEHEVPADFQRYWPYSTFWQARENPPFYGQVIGAYYYPKPNYYIVDIGAMIPELFERGESPAEAARKSKEAWGNFHREENERAKQKEV